MKYVLDLLSARLGQRCWGPEMSLVHTSVEKTGRSQETGIRNTSVVTVPALKGQGQKALVPRGGLGSPF